MPFDYNEFSTSVAKAREAKVSDEDILSHLASLDQGFKDARENGYDLNQIDSFLKEKYKTKGGDNNVYETSKNQEDGRQGDAELPVNGEVQAESQVGVQADGQSSPQDSGLVQGQKQASLKITSPLTGESSLGIGGEPLEKQQAMSVGPRYQGPQAEVQQAIPSEGKAGEQAEVAPKPAPFPTVPSEGDSAGVQYLKSFGTGIAQGIEKFVNLGIDTIEDMPQYQSVIANAKMAEAIFGKNKYTDAFIDTIPQAQKISVETAKKLEESQKGRGGWLNGPLYQIGSLIPDIVSIIALPEAKAIQYTKEGLMAVGAKGLAADLGVIGKKALNGMLDFAPASIASAKMEMDKSISEGKSGEESLGTFYKTLFESEIGAALPLSVTSRLGNVWKRGASRFLQSFGLVAAQNEIATTLDNAISKQQQKAPTITENVLTGKFGDAAKQLVGVVPMALLGIKGGHDDFTPGIGKDRGDLDKVAEYVSQFDLPETADTLSKPPPIPQPQAPKFATRDTIIYNGNKRYTDLSEKRDSGKELTPEETEELSVLEKVPTVEELATHYGITIQESKKKPAKAKAEVQPEKPSETKEQVKETSGVSPEQGKPVEPETTVKVEEGTPQREGEGKKEVSQLSKVSTFTEDRRENNYILSSDKDIDEMPAYQLSSQKTKFGMMVDWAKSHPTLRKIGIGFEMYKKAFEDAKSRGLDLVSDESVTENAFNVYKRLEKEGYDVSYNKNVKETTNARGDKTFVSTDKNPVVTIKTKRKKEVTSFEEASTPEEVDTFLKQNQEDAKLIQETKVRNKFLNDARKLAVARKKEIKAEQKAAAKAEASKPKPSKEPVMEAKAPEPEPVPEEAPKEQGEPKARKPRKEKPSEPMGTRVLSAAFRPNKGKNKGKVFYGASHKQAMLKSGMSWKEISETYAHPEEREGLEFGYKTDTNAFVSRDKAEQVARLSGQADLAKLDADKALGFKMHSNHLSLDDHPETAGQGQKFGPGAMKKTEAGVKFDERDHNADLVKSAKIHKDLAKGEFKGGTNYSAWSKAFEKAFKDAKNYSEDERFNLFKEGESLAAHSEFFKKDLDEAVKFPKMWSGKEVNDIKNESIDRSSEDVRFTQKAIDDDRIARGLNPVMKEAAIASGEHWEEAMEQINSREGYAASFISALKRNVRVLSPVETSILRYSVAEAMAKRDTIAAKLARETDERLIKRYDKEYYDAQREYADLSELMSRTNSEAGRSLGFLRMLVKADYSLPTLITKARAAKRRAGLKDDKLTDEEKKNLTKLSEDIDKTEKEYFDAVEKTKQKENMRGLIEYLEFSSRMISELEGEKKVPKEEVEKFTTMLKNNRQDPITMGIAVRGMARNLSELLKTKNPDKIADAVHDRISRFMGDNWEKGQTMDILNGNGAFHQKSQAGLLGSISRNNDKTFLFNRAFRKALKMKSPKEKQAQIAKILERFSVEVHNLESQVRGHIDDAIIDADRIIGELDYELRSCE